MRRAVERIQAAVAAGERICVHGDYDVDGISATAVAVLVLREAGANVEWRLPSRFEEGYGLAAETIEQLAEQGVDLVLTVDCGITAVDEVARAIELGLDVVVTDHHRPGEILPDCPVVALLFEDEVVESLPRDSWDRPVTSVVTPFSAPVTCPATYAAYPSPV